MRRAQQLGRYHLLDRIAFGGMAEIYRAKTFDATGHAHLVAVKRVLAHLAEDDDFIQMLVDEAKIAGLLRHPNIARVYEFARAHGEYFIAMEYVDGKDLRTILERCRAKKKPIPPQHAAYIASEIATGLHAAHVAVDPRGRPLRIVHRDVSPSNIVCAYAGEVKLCDFGIAKATLSKVNTKTGVIKGKVKYMSPEQALGRKLDHRSDIFSLGSCLYEMLTRVPPFTATNEMDLLIKVRDAKYRPISEIVPGVPRELEAIADKCLGRSRAHRFQTALEAANSLRGFLKAFMPEYTRSHLGRYVRKGFGGEIEKELRMMEEFVLSDQVDDDVGENLIAAVLGNQAEFSRFSPRPPGDTVTRSPETKQGAKKGHTHGHISSVVESDVDTGVDTGVNTGVTTGVSALYQKLDDAEPVAPVAAPAAAGKRGDNNQAGLDIHEASTLILDDDNHGGRIAAPPGLVPPNLAPPPARPVPGGASPPSPPLRRDELRREDIDDALHSAPTLILDHRRDRRRPGGR